MREGWVLYVPLHRLAREVCPKNWNHIVGGCDDLAVFACVIRVEKERQPASLLGEIADVAQKKGGFDSRTVPSLQVGGGVDVFGDFG